MPTLDRTHAETIAPTGGDFRLGPQRPCSGSVRPFTAAEELVMFQKPLLAFLLNGAATPDDQEWLPVELRRVLQLSQTPRECFVLRILAGWSREKCAAKLAIPAETVDEELGAAAQGLARMEEKEHKT